MKAGAYYRSRPSEPDASNMALERQRTAVQESGLLIVCDFVEREGEPGSEGPTAFIAAVKAVLAQEDPIIRDVP